MESRSIACLSLPPSLALGARRPPPNARTPFIPEVSIFYPFTGKKSVGQETPFPLCVEKKDGEEGESAPSFSLNEKDGKVWRSIDSPAASLILCTN